MRIAITGATGFIGRRLVERLSSKGHTIVALSRNAGAAYPEGVTSAAWDPAAGPPAAGSLAGLGAVIHLAGEPIAQRWTAPAKQRIRDSRIVGTGNLVSALAALEQPPGVLVCASAIGYYGSRGDEILTEASGPGSGFLARLCEEWEDAAGAASTLGIRVVTPRIGIVLDTRGGALARMLPPFRLFAGGTLGSGTQWMSWIHLDDLCSLLAHAVEQPIAGALNATAPHPVTNAEFTRTLARVLRRPAFLPAPAFALQAAFGEMSEVLLGSQRVLPQAAGAFGFHFQYPELPGALRNILLG
jgi:uncharacterized protein